MRALPVDLRRRPAWRFVAACVVGVAGAAAALFFGWQAWQAQARHAEVRAQLEALQRRAAPPAHAASAEPPPYAADASALARVAGAGLPAALAAIESVRVDGVRITSLEADAEHGELRLELEAADHAAAIAFVEAMSAGAAEARWEWALTHTRLDAAGGVTATVRGRRIAPR